MKTQALKKYVTIKIEEEIRNQLRLLAAWQQRPQLAVLRDLVEREVASTGIVVPGSRPLRSPSFPVVTSEATRVEHSRSRRDAAAEKLDIQYVSLDEPEAGEFDDN